jgi:hypothetical protein
MFDTWAVVYSQRRHGFERVTSSEKMSGKANKVYPDKLYGEDSHNKVLTDSEKYDIKIRASGNESYLSLALEYGITPSTIRQLVKDTQSM